MNINRKLAINSKWILLGILFVVIISMFFVVNNNGFIGKILHYFGVYTEEINIVQISSDGYKNNVPGSWNVTKSAEWTSSKTAKITFEIDSIAKTEHYKDVVLVLDNSNSMEGQKIDVLKNNTIGLISELLNDSNNRVALITFNSDSTIVSEFSTDKDTLISFVENIDVAGNTDYYKALKNVEYVLDGYQESEDTDLVVLFLTDGYPNISNQVAQYKLLKEKYPYITINGVQYEMGTSTIISQIKSVTDNQFIAERNTLNNVLFKAVYMPKKYIDFELTDYIDSDNFYVDGIDSISATVGNVEFDKNTQKVVWNLDNVLYSGDEDVTLTINVNLLNKFVSVKGYYETNKNVIVDYHLEDGESDIIESDNTPVLKNYRTITFDTNMPAGCSGSIETEEKFIFSKVSDPSYAPVCNGYSFKGWEVEEPDVIEINEDMFIVPTHDVTVRAVWTKNDIVKTMSGVVSEKLTLYGQVKSDADNGRNAKVYLNNGETDIIDDSQTIQNDIYYYHGMADNNNVIFGDFCWEIVRTTETGGVKLIYNGVPSASGSCDNTGSAATIGKSSYNKSTDSIAYSGYMYNHVYNGYSKYFNNSASIISYRYSLSSNYYYSDSFEFSDGKYNLINSDGSDAIYINWADVYKSLKGKYICESASKTTCSNLYYVLSAGDDYFYYIYLSDGKDYDDYTITLSNTVVENDDGSFSQKNSMKILLSEWWNNYDNYVNYYICSSYNDTTCVNMYQITKAYSSGIRYIDLSKKYVYGNSFNYLNGVYSLVDTVVKADWDTTYNSIDNYHYTCWNDTGICEKLYYIYKTDYEYAFYILLDGNETGMDVLNKMLFSDDVNVVDSELKKYIENWYGVNMNEYSAFIEDTVYCNNRDIYDYYGWLDSGELSTNGTFGFYFDVDKNISLSCPMITDKFTVSEKIGNGKLKYPVGLITASEFDIVGSNSYLKNGENYWFISPYSPSNYSVSKMYANAAHSKYVSGSYNSLVSLNYGVRPVISLKPDIEYLDGDGTVTYPYIIDIGQGDESNEN